MRKFCLAILFGTSLATTPAFAARCGGDFNTFVAAMSQEASAAGISQAVISQAFAGVTQDQAVLNFDRRQRYTFNKTFEQYVSTRVGPGRINGGRAMLQRNAALLSQHRGQVRRAAADHRRDLGTGNRFRQGRHGQAAGDPHARRRWRMIAAALNCSRASCWRR